MSLEKVIEILRDADIETVGCTGIEARIDNIDELAERIVKLFAIPVVIGNASINEDEYYKKNNISTVSGVGIKKP